MTRKTNMEQFDEITAKVFATLYESFPLPTPIHCLALTGNDEINEYGEASEAAKICVASLKWLEDEGFLKIKHENQYGAGSVVLTSKALAILKSSPESLEAKQSIGDRLVTAVKHGAISTAIGAVGLILS